MDNNILNFRDLLRKNGLKATPARLAILSLFNETRKPITLKQAANKLKFKQLNLTTLYRNIESLREKQILAPVSLASRDRGYELSSLKHHHHIICEECGKVSDIEKCFAGQIQSSLLKQSGFAEIKRHALEFFGVCKTCLSN